MLYVTYCSREKNPAPGELPAIRRYLSLRIRMVREAASAAGADFRILSGEYGLLAETDPIPDYDHLLKSDEVEGLAELVARQLIAVGCEQVCFFTRPIEEDTDLKPYHEVMRAACSRAEISCTFSAFRPE